MTVSPPSGNDRGTPAEEPSGQNATHAFRAALSEPAHQRPAFEEVAASPSVAGRTPAPAVSEADQEPVPSREPTAIIADPGGRGAGETDTEPALDRPGAPVLAGAAIAGALLVVAPFAVSASMPAVSLSTVAPQSPVSSALGDQTADGSARVGGEAASVTDAGGGGSPVTESVADPGFVPQVQEGSTNPSLPDPGSASEGAGAIQTSAPATQEADPLPPEDTPQSTGAEGTTTEDGSPEAAGGTETASGEASESGTATDSTEEGTPEETAAGETETTSGGENTPASAENDATDAGTSSEAGGEETTAQSSLDGTDTPESASILENATETIVPVEERYRVLTGPGCTGTADSSYGGEGRWQSAEDSAGWTTRPGGYDQEGCDGSYEAIPVSGDPEKGDHQFAAWTFTPGEEGAVCEIYVHVPEDESPLWIAGGETRYRIHPGEDSTEPPVAVFGFDQSEIAGGWVQVTGFVSPAEAFTVRLTNAGEDPFPNDEHTNAHVAASAMRADCS